MKSLQRIILLLIFAGIFSPWYLAAEEVVHLVARGETIWSISRSYSITPNDLMKTNGISDPSKLQVGQRLRIPGQMQSVLPTAAPAAAAVQLVDYRVVRGDTLWGIARNHNITPQRLLDINKFSNSSLSSSLSKLYLSLSAI